MIVAPVEQAAIDRYWPLVEWAFENFAERTGHDVSAKDLRDAVRDGARQCWLAMEQHEVCAVGLTEVVGPNKRVWFDYCAGVGRTRWQDRMVAAIEEWASAIGSEGIRTYSRSGWTPFLRDKGYRETHRIMEKAL